MFRKGGTSSSVNTGVCRKVHTTFGDGSEMVEEFDLKTDELLVRSRRSRTVLGKDQEWEYLVGEPPRRFNPEGSLLVENASVNPVWQRSRDTVDSWVWRVRNLPYPKETYDVRVDQSDGKIVIATANKKFYKRFEIPELVFLELPTDPSEMTWDWKNNTLLIQYRKPKLALVAEAEEKADRRRVRPAAGDADPECKTQ